MTRLHTVPLPRLSFCMFRIVMQACPALAVTAVVSVVDCEACVVVGAVLATVGAAATHVGDTLLVAATSRTKTYTRIILARTSRREGTAEDTREDIQEQQEDTVPPVMVWGGSNQSRASRSWFAT